MINQDRIKMYYDLIKLGIGYESIKLFPGMLKCFWRINGACLVLETSRGKYALWLMSDDGSRLRDEMELLHILREKQVEGFLYPVRLKDNCLYGSLKDGNYFYLTDWPELRGISYRDHIDSILNLLINFRLVMNSYDFSEFNLKTPEKSLIESYQEMIRSMKSFGVLAEYRLNPTRFDQLFLMNWKGLVAEAERALELIRSSAYPKLFAAKESLRPIINNFSRRNLRASTNGQAVCLSIKNRSMDIPVMDLALFMVKIGRANHWGRECYDHLIEKYNEKFLLTDEELEIIRAYLTFPWEAYRLAARYYHNRVNWPVNAFVEKMERILIGNEAKQVLFKL